MWRSVHLFTTFICQSMIVWWPVLSYVRRALTAACACISSFWFALKVQVHRQMFQCIFTKQLQEWDNEFNLDPPSIHILSPAYIWFSWRWAYFFRILFRIHKWAKLKYIFTLRYLNYSEISYRTRFRVEHQQRQTEVCLIFPQEFTLDKRAPWMYSFTFRVLKSWRMKYLWLRMQLDQHGSTVLQSEI